MSLMDLVFWILWFGRLPRFVWLEKWRIWTGTI